MSNRSFWVLPQVSEHCESFMRKSPDHPYSIVFVPQPGVNSCQQYSFLSHSFLLSDLVPLKDPPKTPHCPTLENTLDFFFAADTLLNNVINTMMLITITLGDNFTEIKLCLSKIFMLIKTKNGMLIPKLQSVFSSTSSFFSR